LAAGAFASALAIILTAPSRYLVSAFICGIAGRLSRDALLGFGFGPGWATAAASAIVVLVAVALLRDREMPPVVLISGVLPLGSAVAVFNAIVNLMKVPSLKGEALSRATDAVNGDVGKVFVTSLAIAIGLTVGTGAMRVIRRQPLWE
jgi:uncharacterized membrane protein YjjB (DUF3815 family)